MTACRHVRAELGGYVLDALEPSEVEAVRRHLEECPVCAAEHARLAGLPQLLALADGLEEKPTAPPGIEERLLDAVALERQSRTRPERPRRTWRRLPLPRRAFAVGGAVAAAVVAVVLAFALTGGEPQPARGYEVAMKPVGGSGATATATLHSVKSGTTVHLAASDLAGDPSVVYEVLCEGGGATESAGTFRANASGHAYAVLQTALRRGEYDVIRVVRKQRDMQGHVQVRDVLEARLPTS